MSVNRGTTCVRFILTKTEDGPPHKQIVSDAYYGKTRPPQLQAVEGHNVLCFKTGKTIIQANLDDVFLVPADIAIRMISTARPLDLAKILGDQFVWIENCTPPYTLRGQCHALKDVGR